MTILKWHIYELPELIYLNILNFVLSIQIVLEFRKLRREVDK